MMKTSNPKNGIYFSLMPRLLCILASVFLMHTANAVSIQYTLTSLGGSSYRYDYTVANDGSLGAGVAIEGFAILFDPVLYDETSLTIVTSDPPASDWDELILGSGLLIDAAYDAYALAGGIGAGDSVSGFAVEFAWLAAGTPGAQAFEIYDPDSFNVIQTGNTRTAFSAVPEPGTLVLLFLAATAAAMIRRQRQSADAPASRHAYSR